MFVVFCKCKDCVLFASSIFHIEYCKLRFCETSADSSHLFCPSSCTIIETTPHSFVAFGELLTEVKLCLDEKLTRFPICKLYAMSNFLMRTQTYSMQS